MKRGLRYLKNDKPMPKVSVPADLLVALFRNARDGWLLEIDGGLIALADTLERRATRKLAQFNRSEPK